MGRPKSLSNDGRFVLRKSLGANKKGEYHVYLQYTLDRKQALGVTGVWVKEEDWDETNQKVKQSNSLSARLNGVLKKKKDDVGLLKIEFAEKNPGKRITIDILRKMLQGKYDPNEREIVDFVSLVKEVLS